MIRHNTIRLRLLKRVISREYKNYYLLWESFLIFLGIALLIPLLWPYIRSLSTYIIKVNTSGTEFALVFISVGLFLFSTYIAIARQRISLAFYLSSLLLFCSSLLCMVSVDVPMWLCMVILFTGASFYGALCQRIKPQKKKPAKLPTDLLGRTRMFNRIHSVIRAYSNRKNTYNGYASGIIVAIYGGWGTGKTFFLNYLYDRFSKCFTKEFYDDRPEGAYTSPYRVCKVNLWEYNTPNEAWKGIASILTSTISGNPPIGQHVSRLTSLFTSVMPSPYKDLLFLLTELFFSVQDKMNRELVEKISSQIKLGQKVVIIFDDIERANCDIITGLLPLMEKLKRIEGLLVLCTIAKKELIEKLKSVYDEETTLGYLTKIVDLSFELPNLTDATIQKKISHDLCKKYEDCKLLNIFFKKCKLEFHTPRQIERILDHLSSIERMYFNDVVLNESDGLSINQREEFCVFLIEIVRMFYLPVFNEALEMEGGMKRLASGAKVFSSPLIYLDKDHSKRDKFINDYRITGIAVKRDSLLQDVLNKIDLFEAPIIDRAANKDYARRLTMSDVESKSFIEKHKGILSENLDKMIKDFFLDETSAPECTPDAVVCLFEYTINNIWSDYHAEFLCSLIEDYEKKKDVKEQENYYERLYINDGHIIIFINASHHKKSRNIKGNILNAYELLLRETDMRDHYKVLSKCLSINHHDDEYIDLRLHKNHRDIADTPCVRILLHLCIYYTEKLANIITNKSEQFFENEYDLLNDFRYDAKFKYSRCFRFGIKSAAKKLEPNGSSALNFLKYMIIKSNEMGFPSFCNKMFIMQPLFTKLFPIIRDDVESRNLLQDFLHMCEEALENCNTQKKFQNAVRETLNMLTSISVNTTTTEQCSE